MILLQNNENVTFYTGLYGDCQGTCSNFNLNNDNIPPEIVLKIVQVNETGTSRSTYNPSLPQGIPQGFTQLECGFMYTIILNKGTSSLTISDFNYSNKSSQFESNCWSNDCSNVLSFTENPISLSSNNFTFVSGVYGTCDDSPESLSLSSFVNSNEILKITQATSTNTSRSTYNPALPTGVPQGFNSFVKGNIYDIVFQNINKNVTIPNFTWSRKNISSNSRMAKVTAEPTPTPTPVTPEYVNIVDVECIEFDLNSVSLHYRFKILFEGYANGVQSVILEALNDVGNWVTWPSTIGLQQPGRFSGELLSAAGEWATEGRQIRFRFGNDATQLQYSNVWTVTGCPVNAKWDTPSLRNPNTATNSLNWDIDFSGNVPISSSVTATIQISTSSNFSSIVSSQSRSTYSWDDNGSVEFFGLNSNTTYYIRFYINGTTYNGTNYANSDYFETNARTQSLPAPTPTPTTGPVPQNDITIHKYVRDDGSDMASMYYTATLTETVNIEQAIDNFESLGWTNEGNFEMRAGTWVVFFQTSDNTSRNLIAHLDAYGLPSTQQNYTAGGTTLEYPSRSLRVTGATSGDTAYSNMSNSLRVQDDD